VFLGDFFARAKKLPVRPQAERKLWLFRKAVEREPTDNHSFSGSTKRNIV